MHRHTSDSLYCGWLKLGADSSVCLSALPVYFDDTVLAMWRHGWQRRGQDFTEVLEEANDHRKVHRLVQSDRYATPSFTGHLENGKPDSPCEGLWAPHASLACFAAAYRHAQTPCWHPLTLSLQDGCLGDTSDWGPVGAVQPVHPGNCWELRHAALTPPVLVTGKSTSVGMPHPGFTTFQLKRTNPPRLLTLTRTDAATVFYFLTGGEEDVMTERYKILLT